MGRVRDAADRLRYGFYRRAGLSLRKRRAFQRMVGHVTEPVTRLARVAAGREQHLDIAGHDVVLPPEHRLAYYRHRDAFYDVHPAGLLAALAGRVGTLRLIDIGANVGDTASGALGAAANITVLAVEGNPTFARYARRNLASFGERTEVCEAFVGPPRGIDAVYRSNGEGSGAFVAGHTAGSEVPVRWVSPAELIGDAGEADLVVWKSDIDGLDIHVLAEHWDVITDACEVVWFEYDPVSTLGDASDVAALVERVGASGRGMIVFDNLGNRLVAVAPAADTAGTLRDLTGWLYAQRAGHIMVRYFDVWLVSADLWSAVATVGLQPNPATTTPDPG